MNNTLSNKELLNLYKNAKTPQEQMYAKKTLIKRGFKFTDNQSWWHVFGGACAAFIAILMLAYTPNEDIKKDSQKISSTIQMQPQLNQNSQNDELLIKIKELTVQNEELSDKIVKLNNRLFGLAITSQENWGRIKKSNNEMVTLDQNWLPSRSLEFMQNSNNLNQKVQKMREDTANLEMRKK